MLADVPLGHDHLQWASSQLPGFNPIHIILTQGEDLYEMERAREPTMKGQSITMYIDKE